MKSKQAFLVFALCLFNWCIDTRNHEVVWFNAVYKDYAELLLNDWKILGYDFLSVSFYVPGVWSLYVYEHQRCSQ